MIRRMKFGMAAATIALAILPVLGGVTAVAQSCAMCYMVARATPKEGQRAINRGILVMLLPPLSVMSVGVGLAFRYGRKRDEENERSSIE